MQSTLAYSIADNRFCNTQAVSRRGKVYVLPVPIVVAMQTIHNAALDLSTTARMVLAQLVSCAKLRNLAEPVFPGVATLAKRLGVSERTIQRHLKALVDAGYIERKPQTHKKRGGLAVVHTILKHRVAAITGLPYNPNACGQQLLFDNKNSPEQSQLLSGNFHHPEHVGEYSTIESSASPAPRRPSNPVPHDQFVAVQRDGAHASIPEDLVFLLDKGAHIFQVCSWMARARGAAWKLSDLVQLRKEKILNASNPVGYLVGMLKAVERGEKITQYKVWAETGGGDGEQAAKTQKYLLDQEAAMKRYGDTLAEWSSPGGRRWIKTGRNQRDGLVFALDPRVDINASPIQTMSVVALDNYIQNGSAKVVHEYRPASCDDVSTGFGMLRRLLKKGSG